MKSIPNYFDLIWLKGHLTLFIIFFAVGWIVPVPAAPEAPPAPPLVGAAPDPGSWTIDIKQKNPPPPKSTDPKLAVLQAILAHTVSRMVQQTVEKAGADWHGETLWEDGTKDTYWLYRAMLMYQPRNFKPDQILFISPDMPAAPKKPDHDFPDLDWIKPEFFDGTVMYAGQKCHHYIGTLPSSPKVVHPDASSQSKISAWINFETRLPVAVEDDATLKTYTFHTAPSSIEPQGVFADRYQFAMKGPKLPPGVTVPSIPR